MSKGSFWPIAIVVVAVLSVVGCKKSAQSTPAVLVATSSVHTNYFRPPFQDESQYIIETIVSDLAEQMYFAGHHQLPDPRFFSVTAAETPNSSFSTPVYQLKINLGGNQPVIQVELTINGPIWSPAIYQSVAETLAEKSKVTATNIAPSTDTGLLSALTDGMAVTIEQQSLLVSGQLQNDFNNPALHEQAAVLLGAFALREHSGNFYDIRGPLCRLTVHLVMARFLASGRPLEINGQIAEAMLLTLMNNEADAVQMLNRIATNDQATACWVRTLLADNTTDYRSLARVKNPTLIERIARFRAMAKSQGTDIAWSQLEENDKGWPDFGRIANEEGCSAGIAHLLQSSSVSAELQEIGTVYGLAKGIQLAQERFIGELNETPERCFLPGSVGVPRVQVIAWGQWAMFFQRQLGHAIVSSFDFLQNRAGSTDEARSLSQTSDHLFGNLRLYPFVLRFNSIDSTEYHYAIDDGLRVTVATPQLTPAMCWNYLYYGGPDDELYIPNPNPHVSEWHSHNPLPGTAYNMLPRFDQPSLAARPDAATIIEALHARAPYDRMISYHLIQFKYTNQQKQPAAEESNAIYQSISPFSTNRWSPPPSPWGTNQFISHP